MLGLLVATGIWVWIAGVDLLVDEPFRTFTMLGGPVGFTILHYVLNVLYGTALVTAIHDAAREPSLLIGVAFVSFMIEFGFVMLTILLSHVGLGELAWLRILGGNLVGAVITFVFLARRHPLRRELQSAEEEEAGNE